MKKIINEAQLQSVLNFLQKFNVGVQDYLGIQDMFEKLPVLKDTTDKPEEAPTAPKDEPKAETVAQPVPPPSVEKPKTAKAKKN